MKGGMRAAVEGTIYGTVWHQGSVGFLDGAAHFQPQYHFSALPCAPLFLGGTSPSTRCREVQGSSGKFVCMTPALNRCFLLLDPAEYNITNGSLNTVHFNEYLYKFGCGIDTLLPCVCWSCKPAARAAGHPPPPSHPAHLAERVVLGVRRHRHRMASFCSIHRRPRTLLRAKADQAPARGPPRRRQAQCRTPGIYHVRHGRRGRGVLRGGLGAWHAVHVQVSPFWELQVEVGEGRVVGQRGAGGGRQLWMLEHGQGVKAAERKAVGNGAKSGAGWGGRVGRPTAQACTRTGPCRGVAPRAQQNHTWHKFHCGLLQHSGRWIV